MGFKQKVKKALGSIQLAYENNLLSYPRVDNDFLDPKKRFSLFPHPPMSPVLSIMKPLAEREIPLTKDSSLLYLSMLGLLRPADIYNTAELIDDNFDDELSYRDEKKEKTAADVIAVYQNYLKEVNLNNAKLLKMGNIFYSSMEDTDGSGFMLFSNDEVFFHKKISPFDSSLNVSPLKSYIKWEADREPKKQDTKTSKEKEKPMATKKVPHFKTIKEGLSYYYAFYFERVARLKNGMILSFNAKSKKKLADQLSALSQGTATAE